MTELEKILSERRLNCTCVYGECSCGEWCEGFEAGFKKARELAVAESKQVDEANLHCINLTTILEQLGESEASPSVV